MNPADLILQVLTIGSCSVVLAIPTAALVQAVRKWIPKTDGWVVVLLAAVFASLVVGLLSWPTTVDDARLTGLVAILTWGTAIGGDAWVAKMADKIHGAKTSGSPGDTVPAPPLFEEESPTRKEGKYAPP